jgi:hypothetical protein
MNNNGINEGAVDWSDATLQVLHLIEENHEKLVMIDNPQAKI